MFDFDDFVFGFGRRFFLAGGQISPNFDVISSIIDGFFDTLSISSRSTTNELGDDDDDDNDTGGLNRLTIEIG